MKLYAVARLKNSMDKIFGYRILDIDTGEIRNIPLNMLRDKLADRTVSIKNMRYNNGSLQGIAYSLDTELPVFYMDTINYESYLTILERLVINNKPFFLVSDIFGKLAILDQDVISSLKYRIKNTSFVTNNKISPLVGQFKVVDNKLVEVKDSLLRDLESEVAREDILWTVEDFSMYMQLKGYNVSIINRNGGYQIENIDPNCEIIHLPKNTLWASLPYSLKTRTLIAPCPDANGGMIHIGMEYDNLNIEELDKPRFNRVVFQNPYENGRAASIKLGKTSHGKLDFLMINELKFYVNIDSIQNQFDNCTINSMTLVDKILNEVWYSFNFSQIHNIYVKNNLINRIDSSSIVGSFNNSEIPVGLDLFKGIEESFCNTKMTNAPVQEIVVKNYSQKINGSFVNVPKVMSIADKTMVKLNRNDSNTIILGIKTIGKNKDDKLKFSDLTNQISLDGTVFPDVEILGRHSFTGYHVERLSTKSFPKIKKLGKIADRNIDIENLVINGKEKITLGTSLLETARVDKLAILSDVSIVNDLKDKHNYMLINAAIIINDDADRIAKELSDYAKVILTFKNMDEFNEYNRIDKKDEDLYTKLKFLSRGNVAMDKMINKVGGPHKDLLRAYQINIESMRDPSIDNVDLNTTKLTNIGNLKQSIQNINANIDAYSLKQYCNMLTHIYSNLLSSVDAKITSKILSDLDTENEKVENKELSVEYNSAAICIKIDNVAVFLTLRSKNIASPNERAFIKQEQKIRASKNETMFRYDIVLAHGLKMEHANVCLQDIIKIDSFIISKSVDNYLECTLRYLFFTDQYAITKELKNPNGSCGMTVCEVEDTFEEISKYFDKYNIQSVYEMKDIIADYVKSLSNTSQTFDTEDSRTLYVADWLDSNNIVSTMLLTNEAFDLMEEAGVILRIHNINNVKLKVDTTLNESDRIETLYIHQLTVDIQKCLNIEPYSKLVVNESKHDKFNELNNFQCYIIKYKEKPGKYRYYLSVVTMYDLLRNLIQLARYKEVRERVNYKKLNGIVDGDLRNPNIFLYMSNLNRSFNPSVNAHLAIEYETGYTYIIVEQNDMYYGTAFRFNSIIDAFIFDSIIKDFSETLYFILMSNSDSTNKFVNIFYNIRQHIINGWSKEDNYTIIRRSMKCYPEFSAYTEAIVTMVGLLSHQPAGIRDLN